MKITMKKVTTNGSNKIILAGVSFTFMKLFQILIKLCANESAIQKNPLRNHFSQSKQKRKALTTTKKSAFFNPLLSFSNLAKALTSL